MSQREQAEFEMRMSQVNEALNIIPDTMGLDVHFHQTSQPPYYP